MSIPNINNGLVLQNHDGSVPQNQSVVPMVVETSGRGERAYDIYSLLLKSESFFSARRLTIRWQT